MNDALASMYKNAVVA